MPEPASAFMVPESRLRLSRSPSADLAAAAMAAQQDAGLDAADFIVVAVPPGSGEPARAAVEAAALEVDPVEFLG